MTIRIDLLRRLCSLLLLVLSLFILMACDENNEAELPDFSATNWESAYDVILRLRSGQIELLTRTAPGEVEFKINGLSAQIQSPVFDNINSFYITRINSSQIAAGANLDYELDFAGGHSSGFFKVPWPIDPVFPLFGEGSYSFEWSTTAAPQLYLVDFNWVLQSVPGRLLQQLSGSAVEHTIESELWGGGVIYPDYLSLHAINISRSGHGFLVYAETAAGQQF